MLLRTRPIGVIETPTNTLLYCLREYTVPFIKEVKSRIDEYQALYHSEKLKPLEISDEYDLFPAKEGDSINNGWPNTYPNSERQGIYLILSENHKLLYVGKASMGNTIGGRLGSYFMYDDDRKSCKIRHTWTKKPKYIITVAVPMEAPFEAPALEEYLISSFKGDLPDNFMGAR